nr:hypothetical protein [Tanacetum cinerariifolium]
KPLISLSCSSGPMRVLRITIVASEVVRLGYLVAAGGGDGCCRLLAGNGAKEMYSVPYLKRTLFKV